MQNSLARFKWTALLEGGSFIVLLFICMPLKYGLDIYWPNKIIGMFHGILTVVYVFTLIDFSLKHKLKLTRVLSFFMASLIPFGTFYADKHWLRPLISKESQSA